uniref:Uncharacterized protein n=1 Tax=Chenopodium quinoa TaxID=63459 RepID=A0A803MU17_CHEQI
MGAGLSREMSETGQVLSGRKIVVDVITGGPVHGGSVSGAKKSLSKHRHVVNAFGVEDRPRPSNIPLVSFSEADIKGIVFPHDDPLVLILAINGSLIKRVLVYGVIGFNGSTVKPEGSILLQVHIGEGAAARDVMTEFLVEDVPPAYNAIVGRPMIHGVQAVVSLYHMTTIYIANTGFPERVRGSQTMARECYVTALKQPC